MGLITVVILILVVLTFGGLVAYAALKLHDVVNASSLRGRGIDKGIALVECSEVASDP